MDKETRFIGNAPSELAYWMQNDPNVCKKIGALLTDIQRHPFTGLGKPELLRHRQGWWSRRINNVDRLVYRIEKDVIYVAHCRGHYDN